MQEEYRNMQTATLSGEAVCGKNRDRRIAYTNQSILVHVSVVGWLVGWLVGTWEKHIYVFN